MYNDFINSGLILEVHNGDFDYYSDDASMKSML